MANTRQAKKIKTTTAARAAGRPGREARTRAVKYPYLRQAAKKMGYNFSYLYRVLEGRDPHFKGRRGLKMEYWDTAAHIAIEKGNLEIVPECARKMAHN